MVAGAGIGGLAAALAATRAGWLAHVFEQSAQLGEVGAGIQLGPNATRLLRAWDLLPAALLQGCAPERVVARDAQGGHELGVLPLGREAEARYGAPYLTIHRAELHGLLQQAAQAAGVRTHTGQRVRAFIESDTAVGLDLDAAASPEGDALVAADGLWSGLRRQLLGDAPPTPSDHVAYRGLVPMSELPPRWRVAEVTAWLGPRLHAVSYPVRGGDMLNIVFFLEESPRAGERWGWDHPAAAARLKAGLPAVCAPLRELVERVPSWGLWVLHDRPPVAGPQEMARGRVALLGDAAHPMRPYLAQGAAMALEDAFALGRALACVEADVADLPAALRRYALERWQRCARVQRRSLRNATLFHAGGPLRLGRDLALRSLGRRVMDLPWLYGGSA
ncbi:FAD-dependent oxidoreductase [Ramlibacter rhizophilus]|uniref:FAD-dependent oxidoreductase n=1 Tax=Ramlibacter rhizophilus TaxID=1781167 RepID=A0A4Z0BGH9_9BURK|nr:FAD-dependent oxidoreductase [Ramlibacter rhizophilus]